MIRKFIVIILGLLGITDLSAMIKVSGVFADNMVIQRDAPVGEMTRSLQVKN